MAHVAVIGEDVRVDGFGLAGAVVCRASGRAEVQAAWRSLAEDVAVVVLTPAAAEALVGVPCGGRLTVVMPG
jgi:vacuolar-type H+-ATPase subunit F/Vma7